MGFTPKQVRNGATGSGGEQDTARPGPDASGDVAAGKAAAESYGVAHSSDGHALTGSLAGHTVSFEWDAGLPINDVEGGGSG